MLDIPGFSWNICTTWSVLKDQLSTLVLKKTPESSFNTHFCIFHTETWTSYWKVSVQIYVGAYATCRKLAEWGSMAGKVCAKGPKMLQSGFKSSWTSTRERENHKRALPGTRWGWTNEVSCQCHKECGAAVTWWLAQNEWRQIVRTRSHCSRRLLSRNYKPLFLTCAVNE